MSRCETTRVASHRSVEPAAGGNGSAGSSADDRDRRVYPSGGLPLKLAAIYARVSTDKQEQEETVQSQLAALRLAAGERGYEIVGEFVDEGYSGAHVDRPALDRLRDLAAEGAIEVILVYAPDRLARRYAYQVVVLDELRLAGCEVVFLNHAFGTSPEEQMLLQIQGVFAEYERALIKERMRRGRLFAARQGRVNWGGNPPYGYRHIPKSETTPGKLTVDESEAEIVRQMFGWLIEEEMTTYAVAGRLTARGVPTRGGQGAWRQSTVSDILRKDIYRGETYYNRTMAVDAKRPHMARGFKDQRPGNLRSRAKRPTEEWIAIRVPAIIDPETWELAQAQLEHNRQRAGRNNTQHAYLLRGLLVCGRCGRRMTGVWNKFGGRYVCSARYPRNRPWSCDGRSVMADKIEPLVWEHVRDLLSDRDLLQARYQEGCGDPAANPGEEQERERIERRLKAQQREVQRLVDAYQAEVIELDELRDRRQRIEEHGRALGERLGEIEQQRHNRENEIRLLQGAEAFCASVAHALEEPSWDVTQKVLQLVVDRVIVEDARVVVRHIVPTGPVSLQTGQITTQTPRCAQRRA